MTHHSEPAREAVARPKPLDLPTLLRDAFLAGRGLKDGDKLSEEDQSAWMAYDPERMLAYSRLVAFLSSSPAPAASGGLEAVRDEAVMRIASLIDENADVYSENAMDRAFLGNSEELASLIVGVLALTAPAPASIDARKITPADVVMWAVDRWNEQVKNRPLVNIHRRSLDDAWRRVMRDFGGDPDGLVGPPHDELHAACVPSPKGDEHLDAALAAPAATARQRFEELTEGQDPATVWRDRAFKLADELDALRNAGGEVAGWQRRVKINDETWGAWEPAGKMSFDNAASETGVQLGLVEYREVFAGPAAPAATGGEAVAKARIDELLEERDFLAAALVKVHEPSCALLSDEPADCDCRLSHPAPSETAGEAVATVVWYDPRLDPCAMTPRRIVDPTAKFISGAALGAKLFTHPAPSETGASINGAEFARKFKRDNPDATLDQVIEALDRAALEGQ